MQWRSYWNALRKNCQNCQVSTYLDENLRVNRDSRGDLAIYVRAPAWSIKMIKSSYARAVPIEHLDRT